MVLKGYLILAPEYLMHFAAVDRVAGLAVKSAWRYLKELNPEIH
jgi:hypothetical protein